MYEDEFEDDLEAIAEDELEHKRLRAEKKAKVAELKAHHAALEHQSLPGEWEFEIEVIQREVEMLAEEQARMALRRGSRGRTKSLTIRGIEKESYENFTNRLALLGLPVGEALSRMLLSAVEQFDGTFPTISARSLAIPEPMADLEITDVRSLRISQTDLESANARVMFDRIGVLVLLPGLTHDAFMTYIRGIRRCGTVVVPKSLPKLVILSKLTDCSDIRFEDLD